jgi:hypothetical protein
MIARGKRWSIRAVLRSLAVTAYVLRGVIASLFGT